MFSAIASIAGPIIGGLIQGDAAESASNAQSQGTAAAVAEQRRQYNLNRADLQPYRQVGGQAVTRLGQLLGLGDGTDPSKLATGPIAYGSPAYKAVEAPILQKYALQYGGGNFNAVPPELRNEAYGEIETAYQKAQGGAEASTPVAGFGDLTRKFTTADLEADPVYQTSLQFGLNEGRKGINNMAAARGSLNSGATLKALTRYGTDYGGTKAGESYNRFVNDQTNVYNRLAGVAGTGQTAANTTASMGANTAGTVGGLFSAEGNARGAASLAQGNAYSNALNTVGNYYGQQQTLDKILASRNGSSSPYYNGYGASGDYQYG